MIGCLTLPTVAATVLTICFPIVGLWDGVTEGFLCGVGVVWAAHRFYADPRNALLSAASVVAGLLLLEIATRVFLGTPPAYPIGDGPHLFLATVLRTTGPDSPSFLTGEVPSFL